ncbi:MAG: site-specific integrase [Solirubrobacteraceae bacterium]
MDKRRRSPTFGLRFRAYGRREYMTLGTVEEGWTHAKAQTELQNVLADVRRGIWHPADPAPEPEINRDPMFHEFSSRWFELTKSEWQEKTQLDYEWQLSNHLLPLFKNHRLSQITIAEVDRYRQAKVAEAQAIQTAASDGKPLTHEYVDKRGRKHRQPRRALSVTSINKTITRLGQILEVAVEYGLIGANPAKGRRRRLKPHKAAPVWLDRAEHVEALLDAAGELDRHAKAKGGHDQKGGLVYRRALLATLVFAGLRIGELTALQWRDVDLAGNRLSVRASKTDAGMRQVDLLPTLGDELAAYKAQAPSTAPSGFVFATSTGAELIQGNIRRRVLDKALTKANEKLTEAGDVPLPDGLTPHKLRHTFASILVALGVDPGSVMDQLGHADPGFTLRVYRHGMRRDGPARERLRALVGGAGPTTIGEPSPLLL